MTEINNSHLYRGNCLDIMPSLQENSVDMILCDLPYEQINRANKNAMWDKVIPFDDLWACYKHVIKPKGTIVLFSNGMFTADLMVSNRKWWRYNLIWEKSRPTGFLDANRRPLRSHENISVFTPSGGYCCYNPQKTKIAPRKEKSYSSGSGIYGILTIGGGNNKKIRIAEDRYPCSVLHFNSETATVHPTQKPIALCEWLIRTYSNVGDVVLDNCMGSGSSGVAAVNCDRQFVGIELLNKYFDIAVSRISRASTDHENRQLTFEM